jgi:alkylhydroperoxidase family enzyme
MANLGPHRNALILRITDGDAHSSAQERRSAFDGNGPDALRALIEKVQLHAHKITDEDIAAAKAAGFSEDHIFELVVCAAVGQANRQLECALDALDEATTPRKG